MAGQSTTEQPSNSWWQGVKAWFAAGVSAFVNFFSWLFGLSSDSKASQQQVRVSLPPDGQIQIQPQSQSQVQGQTAQPKPKPKPKDKSAMGPNFDLMHEHHNAIATEQDAYIEWFNSSSSTSSKTARNFIMPGAGSPGSASSLASSSTSSASSALSSPSKFFHITAF